MHDKIDNWDDLLQSVVFSINTNRSATTGFSPFYLMYGRQARLPFEVETLDKDTTPQTEQIEDFIEECQPYDQKVFDHSTKMQKIQQEIFPQTVSNIEKAQEKQKAQYLKRKGISEIRIRDGDLVLRRNMLQKTKKGYKMQDQWLGPYMAVNVDNEKGVCYLKDPKNGMQLKQQTSLKQLKIYLKPSSPLNKTQPEVMHKPSNSENPTTRPPSSSCTTTMPADPLPSSNNTRNVPTEIVTSSNLQTPPSPTTIEALSSTTLASSDSPTSPSSIPVETLQTGIATSINLPASPSLATAPIDSPPPEIATSSNLPISPSLPTVPIDPSPTEIATNSNLPPSSSSKSNNAIPETQTAGHPEKHCQYKTLFEKLQINEIEQILDLLHPEFQKIFTGEENSWYHELKTTGKSTSYPELRKHDIPFNVHFGSFNDDQLDEILRKIIHDFPGVDPGIISDVLLPEAVIRVTRHILGVDYNEAEEYLKCPTCKKIEDLFPKTSNKCKRKKESNMNNNAKKPKYLGKEKDNASESQKESNIKNDEVHFVMSRKSKNNSMKRPNFKLGKEDEAIITGNHMLTDKHVTIAQKESIRS